MPGISRATESGWKSSGCESPDSPVASAGRGSFGEVGKGLSARRECQEVLKRQLQRQPPIGLAWSAVGQRLRHLKLKAVGALPKFMEVLSELMYVHKCHLGGRGLFLLGAAPDRRGRAAVALALLTTCIGTPTVELEKAAQNQFPFEKLRG